MRRAGHYLWLLVSALAIAIFSSITVLALPLYIAKPQPYSLPPSGDPLLDRYAAYQMHLKHMLRDQDREHFKKYMLTVPLDVLKDWETEFASDSRYWNLRMEAANWQLRSKFPTRGTAGLAELKEAREQGLVDGPGLLLLWQSLQGSGLKAEELSILDEAVRIDPTYNWVWYTRGLWHLEQGNEAQALIDIETGNQLPIAAVPGTLAYSALHQALRTGEPEIALNIWAVGGPTYNCMWVFMTIKNHLSASDFVAHPELFSALHKMSCRMFEGCSTDFSAAILLDGCVSYIGRHIHNYAVSSGKPLRVELEELLQAHNGLTSRVDDLAPKLLDIKIADNWPKAIKWIPGKLVARGPEEYSHQMYFRGLRRESEFVKREYTPYFAALENVDFEKPEVTEAMKALLENVPDPWPEETAEKTRERMGLPEPVYFPQEVVDAVQASIVKASGRLAASN